MDYFRVCGRVSWQYGAASLPEHRSLARCWNTVHRWVNVRAFVLVCGRDGIRTLHQYFISAIKLPLAQLNYLWHQGWNYWYSDWPLQEQPGKTWRTQTTAIWRQKVVRFVRLKSLLQLTWRKDCSVYKEQRTPAFTLAGKIFRLL